jgi:hypothetical protein
MYMYVKNFKYKFVYEFKLIVFKLIYYYIIIYKLNRNIKTNIIIHIYIENEFSGN